MQWATWKNVGVDRIGCAWLIRRIIDADAKFVFVERGSQWPIDAEPFDIPNVKFGHHDGHCSFHALLKHSKNDDPVLHRIARIIDEADTIQSVQVEPAAPGLDLICEGIRLISTSDSEAIDRGCIIYDALYAKLRE